MGVETGSPLPRQPALVRARAPLRLGFGGGGSDLSPYCDIYGGSVLNATIDKYAYAIIEPRQDSIVEIVAEDQGLVVSGRAGEPLTHAGVLHLQQCVYNRVARDFCDGRGPAMTLTTSSDAPPGSGLGSSSTLVVAMLKAFVELLNLPLGEYDVAHLAFEIERGDAGLAGGRQDQYAATFGGVNFMEFYAGDRVVVNPLRVKNWILSELEASTVLCFTGQSRSSAVIIDEQVRNLSGATSGEAVEAMHRVKREAVHMKESLLRGDLRQFVEAINTSWEAKKRTAHNISNDRIEAIADAGRAAGAAAVKVSGAGGGGFMMFFVDPARRARVMRALEARSAQTFTCHFTKHGTEGWKIY
jgi:D-glycero-alpha-D-manno-heptose-7-phosphate kinase